MPICLLTNLLLLLHNKRSEELTETTWPLKLKMCSTWPFIETVYQALHRLSILPSYPPPTRASLVAQLVKNPPAMQETWV